jgi:hypothetical protein
MALIESPLRFRHPAGGNLAYGYPATILADICDAVLAARKAGHSIEDAAAREYLYRWRLALQSPVFGAPHTLGM